MVHVSEHAFRVSSADTRSNIACQQRHLCCFGSASWLLRTLTPCLWRTSSSLCQLSPRFSDGRVSQAAFRPGYPAVPAQVALQPPRPRSPSRPRPPPALEVTEYILPVELLRQLAAGPAGVVAQRSVAARAKQELDALKVPACARQHERRVPGRPKSPFSKQRILNFCHQNLGFLLKNLYRRVSPTSICAAVDPLVSSSSRIIFAFPTIAA